MPALTGGYTDWLLPVGDSDLEMYWTADNAVNSFTSVAGAWQLKSTTNAKIVGITRNSIGTAVDMTVARRLFYAEVTCQSAVALVNSLGPVMLAVISDTGANQKSVSWPVQGGKGAIGEETRRQGVSIRVPNVTDATSNDAGFDGTQVIGHGMGLSVVAKTTENATIWKTGYLDPYVITGGTVSVPADFSIITDDVADDVILAIESPSANLHFCKNGWITGDGVIETHFEESLKTWEFVGHFVSGTATYTQSHLDGGDIGYEENLSATCTRKFTLCNFIGDGTALHYHNSIGSTLASSVKTNCVIKGAFSPQIVDGRIYDFCTFDACEKIVTTAPSFTDTIIKNGLDNVFLELVDSVNMLNMTFEGSGTETALLFDFAGDATVVFDGYSFSNLLYDVEYTGTGTLTINQINGANITSTNASGGGTIVVNGAVVEQGVSFTGLATDSQVYIYEAGTLTVIDSVESSTTAFEWKELYTVDRDVDYTIIKEGKTPIRVPAAQLSSTVVPITVQQADDRPYQPSTGLTFATDLIVDTVAKTLDLTTASTLQNCISALVEFFRAETSLRNITYPVNSNGPNSFTLVDGWEFTSASLPFLSRDGLRYQSGGVDTAIWAAILLNGDVTGLQSEYQQVQASAPVDQANATGNMDELVQVFGDATHGNFDYRGYLYIKHQDNGYMEDGLNVVDVYGTLEDQLYQISVQPEVINGFIAGDPSITGVTITNHGATPVTWNGKDFSITITDTGGNTGENIQRWLNYNKSLDATFEGLEPFNMFDMVVNAAGTYETQVGMLIGSAGALVKGVRVIDGAGDPHSFFTRFQCDDETYYVPPQQILLQAPNLEIGRVQLFNMTGATASSWVASTAYVQGDYVLRTTGLGGELGFGIYMKCTVGGTSGGTEPTWDIAAEGNTTVDGGVTWETKAAEVDNSLVTGAYNYGWTSDTDFATGDTIRMRWASDQGDKYYIEVFAAAPASGSVTFVDVPENDPVYLNISTAYGKTGSQVTDYVPDFPNVQIDIDPGASTFLIGEMYLFYKYILSNDDGLRILPGAILALDEANMRIITSKVNLFIDSLATQNIAQADKISIVRDDGLDVRLLNTTGGYGMNMWGQGQILSFTTGSGPLSTAQQLELTAAASSKMTEPELHTGLDNYVNKDDWKGAGGGSSLTEQQVRDAMKLAPSAGAPIAGSIDDHLDAIPIIVPDNAGISANGDAIAALNNFNPNTDTVANVTNVAVTAINSDMRGTDNANTIAPDNAGIAANATAISVLHNFDPINDTVANVTTVAVTTINTDMRGTDGANTVVPDNSGIVGIQTDLNNTTDGLGVIKSAIDSINITPATVEQIADGILIRNLGGGLDGGRTIQDALRANRNRVVIDDIAKTVTVYEEDDITVAWTGDITIAERDAINSVDPA